MGYRLIEPAPHGGTPDFKSDRDDRMGAKIKTQKNPLGFKQNHPKNPWTKFHPQKVPCHAEFIIDGRVFKMPHSVGENVQGNALFPPIFSGKDD